MQPGHRRELGRSRHAAGGEGRVEKVADRGPRLCRSAHSAHQLVHGGIALDHPEPFHADRPRHAHPRQVVAHEVDDHDVLRTLLAVAGEFCGERGVFEGIGAPGPRSLDGARPDHSPFGVEELFRTGAQQRVVADADETAVVGGSRSSEAVVHGDRVMGAGNGEACGQTQLVGDACADEVTAAFDECEVFVWGVPGLRNTWGRGHARKGFLTAGTLSGFRRCVDLVRPDLEVICGGESPGATACMIEGDDMRDEQPGPSWRLLRLCDRCAGRRCSALEVEPAHPPPGERRPRRVGRRGVERHVPRQARTLPRPDEAPAFRRPRAGIQPEDVDAPRLDHPKHGRRLHPGGKRMSSQRFGHLSSLGPGCSRILMGWTTS